MFKTWLSISVLFICGALCAHSQHKALSFASISEGGEPYEAAGVLINDKGRLATIALVGADPRNATVKNAKGEDVSLKLVIHDPVSRLTLLELPESEREGLSVMNMIGDSSLLEPGDAVFTDPLNKVEVSRVVSRVQRHNGKILPLEFVKINHPSGLQKPGIPILNSKDELVAFVFQKDTQEKTMFALPVEVLANIESFITDGSARYRPCWIGVSMDRQDDAPTVIGVRPDTPARKAGLKRDDVVISIGGRKVSDYSAVVNAFYYLQAGKETEFKVLRGTEILNLQVIPEINPLYK